MLRPEIALEELFVDLHTSGHWADGKAIADSVLLSDPAEILAAYREAKAVGPVDLSAFYDAHFRPVRTPDESFRTDPRHGPLEHLARLWPVLIRAPDRPDAFSSRISLTRPYVVVGGRFQESYYWDSYFSHLGLLRTGQFAPVRDMLDNFADTIRSVGHIPNGFRTYLLSRSQPPFFASMVRDYGRATGDLQSVYAEYLDAMRMEHRFFLQPQRTVNGLAHYWDEEETPRPEMLGADLELAERVEAPAALFRNLRAGAESGWDFSSRWLSDPSELATIHATDIWPVDLNSILFVTETILSEAASDDPDLSRRYRAAADARAEKIRAGMWDDEKGYFFDRRISRDTLSDRNTAAGLFPLWAGVATQSQADRSADWVRRTLLAPGGLLTTDIESGEQWDSPNGWAPLQWIAIQGLRRYGHDALADDLKRRWLNTCDLIFRKTGKFVEKYNVLSPGDAAGGGEYPLQDGFGWTNGVYQDLSLEETPAAR
ncbi:trehalase family glycosidase [Jannaschia seohaensis]|uniref:Alpha,alpha-trehalase n=1 Tax=Jannaschia seohaensis TaxID=475081 RepID=A0A2Y9C8Q4_9RHOB|nr:trehalase family glycosidase [Jannaschia seohaensis]PWJ15054.1 alpha,alpha-trehalase [Jannaschia seohaensis]SSA49903.1 alpha,alpha-trehalase [Jannaschia seohaensis]